MDVVTYKTQGDNDKIYSYLNKLPVKESASGYEVITALEEDGIAALNIYTIKPFKDNIWKIKFHTNNWIYYEIVGDSIHLLSALKNQKNKTEETNKKKFIKRAKELENQSLTQVDVNAKVTERIVNDPEFKKAYLDAKREYKLIKQIVEIRKGLTYSQKYIADKIGVKKQVISKLETIGNSQTLDDFVKYADALGLEIKFEKKQ